MRYFCVKVILFFLLISLSIQKSFANLAIYNSTTPGGIAVIKIPFSQNNEPPLVTYKNNRVLTIQDSNNKSSWFAIIGIPLSVNSGLGYFFEVVGENKLAEKHYHKAIFLGGKNGLFHNNYGTYLCGQGRYKEADKEFLNAVRDYNYTKTADAYENAGLCALKAQDVQKAENYFKVAIRHDPKQHSSLIELAEISFDKHELRQAKNYLSMLREQVEPSPRVLWLTIRIAKQSDDKDLLASDALLLKNLFPNSEEYNLYLKTL